MPFRPSATVAVLDRWLYPGYGDRWDEDLFSGIVRSHLRPDFHVLDIGAGAGIVPQMNFRGEVARVAGIDLDPRVRENPHLDEGRVGTVESLPWPDESFDLAFSDNVLEHLEHPQAVFSEIRRVLKPGGRFLAKTPNRLYYVSAIARLTPLRFHRFVNRKRGRADVDTFPTLYRVNTPKAIREVASKAGLVVDRVDLVDGRPEYLRLTAPTYLVGWVIERMVTRVPGLERFRAGLIAVLHKASDGASAPAP